LEKSVKINNLKGEEKFGEKFEEKDK